MRNLFIMSLMSVLCGVLLGCGDNNEEKYDILTGEKPENAWGFNHTEGVDIPNYGGKAVITSDSAMYLLELSEYYAHGVEGWNRTIQFDTVYKEEHNIVYCNTGPKEGSAYGAKVHYISHHEVHFEVVSNNSGEDRLFMLSYAPVGKAHNSSVYLENIIITQKK